MGKQTEYLWMFISLQFLRDAKIFHLGIASADQRFYMGCWWLGRREGELEDNLVTETAHIHQAVSICLYVMSLNLNPGSSGAVHCVSLITVCHEDPSVGEEPGER